jgi:hypothetical protein
MDHSIDTVRIGNDFLLLVSQWNEAETGLIEYDEVVTLVHEPHNWRLPKLVHFEAEFDQARVHFNDDDNELINMNGLIADDHLDLVLSLALHVFSFDDNEVERRIVNLQFVCPLDYKLRPLRLHLFVDVNLEEEVAELLLILIGQDVKLLVEECDGFHA